MACCGDQIQDQSPLRATPEMLASMPETTWCCMARMAYELARVVTDANEPAWAVMPIQSREAWAQMLRRALTQDELPAAPFDLAVVKAARVMVNAA